LGISRGRNTDVVWHVSLQDSPQNTRCTSYTYSPYSFKHPETNRKGTYYWGGGPFQNGTTALNASWYAGFDPKVFGFVDIGSRTFNPEPDRPLNKSPKRTYYVNASLRLAKLIDSIYEKYPNDTVAVVSHSQGTMIAALAMLYVKRVPDTLFLCNSPYCFEDKGVDGVAMGGNAPTARSRVKTFFNILDKFKESQSDVERKITEEQLEGVGAWLDIKTLERSDGRVLENERETDGPQIDPVASLDYQLGQCAKWKPTVSTEQPVPGVEDHHNHGRLFVYCSPHENEHLYVGRRLSAPKGQQGNVYLASMYDVSRDIPIGGDQQAMAGYVQAVDPNTLPLTTESPSGSTKWVCGAPQLTE
jgi:pimeloyl-ACP methyl ester carboxylesterase